MQGEVHLVRDLAEQVECIWEQSPDAAAAATPTALAMVAEAFSLSGDIDRAALYLRRAADLPPSSNMMAELQGAAFHAQSLGWAERYSEARHQLTTLLHAARRLASPTILAFALAISAEIGWWSGQWTTAYADATEALQWATENGQPGLLGYGLSMLARIEAARGERESCQARVDKARAGSRTSRRWLHACVQLRGARTGRTKRGRPVRRRREAPTGLGPWLTSGH